MSTATDVPNPEPRQARRRTVVLAFVALLILVPIAYGLGFVRFASGLAPPNPFKSEPADWVGSVAFGFACSVLAFGIGRLLVRGAFPLAAALVAAVPIVALTGYLVVQTFAYRDVIPLAGTLMDSLGFILGLIAAALPERRAPAH